MMGQVRYEFHKILTRRIIYIILPILLVLNVFMFWNEAGRKNGYFLGIIHDYKIIEMKYTDMSFEKAKAKVENEYEKYRLLSFIDSAKSFYDGEYFMEELQKIQKTDPKLLEEYNNKYKDDNLGIYKGLSIYEKLNKHMEYIDGYYDYIGGIGDKAQDMLTFSIFNKQKGFSRRNILRTPTDYKHLKGIPLKLGLEEGLVAVANFRITDILAVIFSFLICAYLFLQEKEKGLYTLIKSCKNGRLRAISSKLGVTGILCGLVALILYGSSFIASGIIFGFGDTSRYIQSMPYFESSNLLLTVHEYIWVFIALKICVILLISLIFSVLFLMLQSSAKIYLSIGVISAVSLAAYVYILPLSAFNLFKYINLFAFLDTGNLLGRYYNISFFGFPINRVSASLVVILGLIAFLSIMNCLIFINRGMTIVKGATLALWEKIKGYFKGYFGSTCLLWHELWKLLFLDKAILMILLLLYLGYTDILKEAPEVDFQDRIYKGYMNELEGPLTPHKGDLIAREREFFDSVNDQLLMLDSQYKEGIISKGEHDIAVADIGAGQTREKAFREVESQYFYLLSLKEKGIDAAFVDRINSDYIFFNYNGDIKNALILSAVIIVAISMIFSREYKSNMTAILRSAKKGRGSLFANKLTVAWLFSVTGMVIVYTPKYINAFRFFGPVDFSAHIQNIQRFAYIESNLSIGGFIIMDWVITLLGVVSMALFVVFVSVFIKKQAVTVFISSLVVLVPIIFEILGFSFLRKTTLNNIFLVNRGLEESKGSQALIIYLLCLLVVITFMTLLGYKRYKESG